MLPLVLEHPAERAAERRAVAAWPAGRDALRGRGRAQPRDRGVALLPEGDTQVEIAAQRGARGLADLLDRAERRVHIAHVGLEHVQEDVAERAALGRLFRQGLRVDLLHELQQIGPRPFEPA